MKSTPQDLVPSTTWPIRSDAEPAFIPAAAAAFAAIGLFCLVAALSILQLRQFDYATLHVVNLFSRRSAAFDNGVAALTKDMFSNLLMVSLVWFAWFATENADRRAELATGTIMSYAAGILSRLLQLALPTHLRPLHDPQLGFTVPYGVDPAALNHWASFPSDHAAVFFGLVLTIFRSNRSLGWIALAVALALNCIRVYLGLHFPTDIIGGAMIGVLVVGATRRLHNYAASFYLCFGIATLFNDYRDVASGLAHALKAHVPH